MKTTNYSYLFLFLLLINSSCNDFLLEEPKAILSPSTYPASEEDIVQVFGGAHTELSSITSTPWQLLTFVSTDISGTKQLPGDSRGDLDHYSFQSDNTNILQVWERSYRVINSMNQVLAKLEENDQDWVKPYIGAAQTQRAFMYFNLVQLYGDLPLITVPSSEIDLFAIERESVSKVYEQIIADLLAAESNLEGTNLDNPILPSFGFAKALLSKVYMTMAGNPLNDSPKWALAAKEAAELVDLDLYQLVPNYEDLFLIANEDNSEVIFSLQSSLDGDQVNSSLTRIFRPANVGVQRGNGQFFAEINFYNEFSENDIRRDVSMMDEILSTTGNKGGDPKVYHYTEWGSNEKAKTPHIKKYFDTNRAYEDWQLFGRKTGTNWIMLRYADVLLTLAESENEVNGPTEAAYSAINQLRVRAGLAPYSGLSKDAFRDAVRLEREKELCFEGHRRFDLLRWGNFLDVMKNDRYAAENVKAHHVLFPIPQVEIQVNPDLAQNPGYN